MTKKLSIPGVYWVYPGELLAGPYPWIGERDSDHQRVRQLIDAGIRVFLDLTEAGEARPYAPALGDGVRHVRMPIIDFDVPPAEKMRAILDVIDAARADAQPVYVHCFAGLGRTGTVVGCYLVRHGLSGVGALREIERLRRDISHGSRASPITEAQRWMVMNWSEPDTF
jgi:hypothetical protein